MQFAGDSSNPEQVRTVLADDHRIFRQALRTLLQQQGIDIVGEAADGLEAVRTTEAFKPDVAILDYHMPGLNGIEAARRIHACSPHTQSILLTMSEDPVLAADALRAGMHGCVLKSESVTALVSVVREVASGAIHLSAGVSRTAIDAYTGRAEPASAALTPRETEVLRLIADGLSTQKIATSLGLSTKTIESHRSRIMNKLDLHRVADLTRYAVRRHLVAP